MHKRWGERIYLLEGGNCLQTCQRAKNRRDTVDSILVGSPGREWRDRCGLKASLTSDGKNLPLAVLELGHRAVMECRPGA